jgi:hypothetical protein
MKNEQTGQQDFWLTAHLTLRYASKKMKSRLHQRDDCFADAGGVETNTKTLSGPDAIPRAFCHKQVRDLIIMC